MDRPSGSHLAGVFGMPVMETIIQSPLKGEAYFDWRPEGLACEIALVV
jgi:hypothetical protein